jgi:hypothetical protein
VTAIEEEVLASRRARLLDGALEGLAARSTEAAVENLVAFVISEGGAPGPRFPEACELLRKTTGLLWPPSPSAKAKSF